jgi:hypothetical protein
MTARLPVDHYTQGAFSQWCNKEDTHRIVSGRRSLEYLVGQDLADVNARSGNLSPGIGTQNNPDLPPLGRRFFKQAFTGSRLGLGSYGNPSPSKIANSFAESLPSLRV